MVSLPQRDADGASHTASPGDATTANSRLRGGGCGDRRVRWPAPAALPIQISGLWVYEAQHRHHRGVCLPCASPGGVEGTGSNAESSAPEACAQS